MMDLRRALREYAERCDRSATGRLTPSEALQELVEEREGLADIVAERQGDLDRLQSAKRSPKSAIDDARDSLTEAEHELDLFDQGHEGNELRRLQGLTDEASTDPEGLAL